jgi:phosphoglycolate phosphatase-like HAD superfamily hydrolase
MLGLAPVLDFDGTLAQLDVDWPALRAKLNVERIEELWSRANGWDVVTDAEVRAAETALPVLPAAMLSGVRCFAVLTSNDARAVRRFMDRFPQLRERLTTVVGREELGGPKSDFACFELGIRQCMDAMNIDELTTYVGDAPYELDFARRLGLTAIDVRELVGSRNP